MNKRTLSTILLLGTGLLFSMSIALLAPLPLMVLRKSNGRFLFWMGLVSTTLALYFSTPLLYPVVFFSAGLLAGLFVEAEEKKWGYTAAVAVSVLGAGFFLGATTAASIYAYGFDPVDFMRQQIATLMAQVTLPTGVTIDQDSILKQVPSGILICLVLAAWFNSLLAQRFDHPHIPKTFNLKDWKLAEPFVWVALASAAGSFLIQEPQWIKWAATNIFNIVVLLYFFQGLAVVVHYMVVKQVSSVWRSLAYVLAFFQLFLFVALIGFVDLWVDFRRRMKTDKSAIA